MAIVEDGTERATVNVAEYSAVLNALRMCCGRSRTKEELQQSLQGMIECEPVDTVNVYTDSLLIVNQLNSIWSCNDPHLDILRQQVLELKKYIKQLFNCTVTFRWIPRAQNDRADFLSKTLHSPPLKCSKPKKGKKK